MSGEVPDQLMTQARRVATTEDAIRILTARGLNFRTVIDVGVNEGTPKLMRAVPNAHHVLIEPSPAHAPAIAKAYQGIDHRLHRVAVGDEDTEAFIVDTAIDGGTAVTHSAIVANRAEAEAEPGVLQIHELPVRRLDTLLSDTELADDILLKIDVDGHELPVLRGATDTLRRAAVVTIEAPRGALVERAAFLQEAGFALYDIVDLDYYDGVLWQVDVLFVRNDLMQRLRSLNPIPGLKGETFRPEAYRSLQDMTKPWTSRLWRKLRGRG